jgi:hypothetical protein
MQPCVVVDGRHTSAFCLICLHAPPPMPPPLHPPLHESMIYILARMCQGNWCVSGRERGRWESGCAALGGDSCVAFVVSVDCSKLLRE